MAWAEGLWLWGCRARPVHVQHCPLVEGAHPELVRRAAGQGRCRASPRGSIALLKVPPRAPASQRTEFTKARVKATGSSGPLGTEVWHHPCLSSTAPAMLKFSGASHEVRQKPVQIPCPSLGNSAPVRKDRLKSALGREPGSPACCSPTHR